MERSYDILNGHEINSARRARNLKPANSIWFWSPGKSPGLPDFREKYGLRGAVVAATDLMRGIAVCAGMEFIKVEGATGNFHTNYAGKGQAAISILGSGADFVYVHVEAPDECGHQGNLEEKIRSIELIDEKVVFPLYGYLEENRKKTGEGYRIMVLPDHPTPVSLRTHTADPVPFLIYEGGSVPGTQAFRFSEDTAGGLFFGRGHDLIHYFLRNK